MLKEKMKGEITLKKIFIYISSLVASFSFMITSLNTNTSCLFLAHQPKLPKEAEKLSKY